MVSKIIAASILALCSAAPIKARAWENRDRTSLLYSSPVISRTVEASSVSRGKPEQYQLEIRCEEGSYGYYLIIDGSSDLDDSKPRARFGDGPVEDIEMKKRDGGELLLQPPDISMSNEELTAWFRKFETSSLLVVRLPLQSGRIDAEFPLSGFKENADAADTECLRQNAASQGK